MKPNLLKTGKKLQTKPNLKMKINLKTNSN